VSAPDIVPLGTTAIAIRTAGNAAGLPIVFMHGVGGTSEIFAQQFDGPLAERFRLVGFDLPGHGHSTPSTDPDHDYTIGGLADIAAQVIERLELGRVVLFGWSLGGHVAIEMMARHPRKLAGVMLSGAPPFGSGPLAMLRAFKIRREMRLAARETYSRRDAEEAARVIYGPDATEARIKAILETDGAIRPRVNRSFAQGDRANQARVVETSMIPLAVVNGADDPLVRVSYFDDVAYANLWERRAFRIEGAAHVPFLSHPNSFNAILYRFASDMALRETLPLPAVLAQSA
jgi:pimeloyl-ACP methyl ester carboxylesterase